MARFDPELSLWIRWLHIGCQLPLEHVAAVLGREQPLIAAWFDQHVRHLGFTPSGPPRRIRGTAHQRLISSRTGTRIRVLSNLGYGASQIASILAIDVEETTDFLRRLEPIRCTKLRRPRLRNRKRPHLPNQRPISPELYDTQPNHQVIAKRTIELNPSRSEWIGPTSFAEHGDGGKPKLDEKQVVEARELLLSGASYPSVAARFHVSVNTLRRYVHDIGLRRSAPSRPTNAVSYAHGVVRWDKPLIHAHGTRVLVECECGRERYVFATHVERPGHVFTGRCECCALHKILLSKQDTQEAARLRSQGCSWTTLGKRFGVSRNTVRSAVQRLGQQDSAS